MKKLTAVNSSCMIIASISTIKYNLLHFETHKRTFNDWAQGDEDKVLYLKQICLSSIDGNGRNVLHLLVGSGGNGNHHSLLIQQFFQVTTMRT